MVTLVGASLVLKLFDRTYHDQLGGCPVCDRNRATNLRMDEKFLIAEQAERDVLKHFFNGTGYVALSVEYQRGIEAG